MESNIKGLVSAGHEMASELKAECGAVDMRSVAKLISDLATQLEVQLVRANAMAAENAGLKDYLAPIGLKVEGTPTTDAFLAEVRAQGLEMFAQKCNSKSEQSFASDIRDNWKLLGEHATDFAAELRKGGKQ
ncbi:TPA: hypothetical protein SIE94_000603 [Escherichia coli]|uniref:hypothetical protein n=1 Tax=Escherichia coli TaxID=562 RepID=UPI0015C52868|nr:hypothetical protein [Escherichia coli]HEI0406121.1 hypothetical protein [Escherichia coli]